MARYVSLIRFTDQGARTMNKSAARAHLFHDSAEKAGVKVEAQLWTVGSCDGVLILNGETQKVLRFLAQLVELGNVRTETLQAFEAGEFQALLGN